VRDDIASFLTSRDQLEESEVKVIKLEEQVETKAESERFLLGRISVLEGLLSVAQQETADAAEAAVEAVESSKTDDLTKENAVLSEAVEFLHNQVDDLETEIKAMKFTSSLSAGPMNKMMESPARRHQSLYGVQPASPSVHQDVSTKLAMEMAFLMPLLRGLKQEAAHYRARSVVGNQVFLRPLNVPDLLSGTPPSSLPQPQEGNNEDGDNVMAPPDGVIVPIPQRNKCEVASDGLRRSVHAARMMKAEMRVVDLSSSQRRPREVLRNMKMDMRRAAVKIEERSAAAVRLLEGQRVHDDVPLYRVERDTEGQRLLGKVIIGRNDASTAGGDSVKDEMRVISLRVTSDDLQCLHKSFLRQ